MDEHNLWHGILYNAGIRISTIGVLAILALFLVAETMSVADDLGRPSNPATDVITVSGDGQASVAPDVARISFSVTHTGNTVADAQTATTKQANAALDFVKGQGVADKDVKTLSYDISPQYSYPKPCLSNMQCPAYGGTPKITGYQVSETVQITLRDITKVGTMLEGLGTLGVQNVNGPAFALDNATAGYDAARADAIDKAKVQAKVLAKQLGVSLGKIVNFSESSGGYQYQTYSLGGAVSMDKAAAPNIPAGENTYHASVSITYEIR